MAGGNWVDIMGMDELRQGDVVSVEIAGRDIAIYTVDGNVYATDDACTHAGVRLSDGFLEGYTIECPLHQGRFDVRNGTPLCEPVTEPLRTYEVKVEGRRVYVRIDD